MMEEKKDEKESGPLVEQPAAAEGQADIPSTGDEENLQGSRQVPPPPASRGASGNGGFSGRNLNVLLVTGVALLVVALVMSSIALGLALASHDGDGGNRGMMNRARMNRSGGGTVRQELRNLKDGGQVSIIRGNVATVDGGNVTIQTPTGNETVVITDSTRFRGAGLAGNQVGASDLKSGQQVTVFAEKTKEGKLEAIVVRAGAENPTGK